MPWAGCWLGPLLGAASAGAVYTLLREIKDSCRIGINASARGFSMVFSEAPRTFMVVAVASAMAYALLRRAPVTGRTALAVIGAVSVALVVVWITVATQHHPYGGNRDCLPGWWPRWISL